MNELRMGICGCTNQYHGQFDKTEIYVPLPQGNTGMKFVLIESTIPEENQREVLLKHRCHFFLDMHTYGGNHHITLDLQDYVPHSRREGEVAFHGWMLNESWKREVQKASLPSSTEIKKAMRKIIRKLDLHDFYGWMMHLTPVIDDPRGRQQRGKDFEAFATAARAARAKRLRVYHCYPHCISTCVSRTRQIL